MGRALLVDALGRVGASFFWFLQSVSGSERLSYGVLAREGDRQGGVISAGFGFLQRCFAIDPKTRTSDARWPACPFFMHLIINGVRSTL